MRTNRAPLGKQQRQRQRQRQRSRSTDTDDSASAEAYSPIHHLYVGALFEKRSPEGRFHYVSESTPFSPKDELMMSLPSPTDGVVGARKGEGGVSVDTEEEPNRCVFMMNACVVCRCECM